VAGFPTASVDQLGAGDAFDAGLIRGLVAGAPAAESVRQANAAAALAIAHPGGRGFPGLGDFEALLAAHRVSGL
jgi:sugar/nucleoside kinase (ribokinase family)